MTARQHFLAGLFRLLDARAIAYCVLRNYDDLVADGATADLDLILEKRDLLRFNETLQAAAAESGHRFVQRTRFVNYSCVFWNPSSGFIRVDFETEVRWRVFTVLSATNVLEFKQRRENFYVPHPRHESVVLFVQALWVGELSDRYRRRLAHLYEACPDKAELRRTYEKAFGSAGAELATLHAGITECPFDSALCSRLKRSLLVKTLFHPSALVDFALNSLADLGRFCHRVRQPAGISLLYVSALDQDQQLDDFMRQVEFLFPAPKCLVHRTHNWRARRGFALEGRRLRVLFKGGIFVQYCQPIADVDLPDVIESQMDAPYSERVFVCTRDSRQRTRLAHPGTGSQAGGETDLSALLIGFIATILEREQMGRRQPQPLVGNN